MTIVDLIGGIAPESTIEYYRLLIGEFRARTGNASYPAIVINSIDLTKMIGMIGAGGVPVLDTTRIHVERIVQEMLRP